MHLFNLKCKQLIIIKIWKMQRIFFLIGASGSGKSVIAKRVSQNHNFLVIDTDSQILKDTNYKNISDIFQSEGENFFRELEVKCIDGLSKIECNGKPLIVATGGGLPAIPGMMEKLNSIGKSIYLKANINTLWKRLTTDPKQLDDRPLLKLKGKKALAALVKKRENTYTKSSIVIDTEQLDVDEVCDLLITNLLNTRNKKK
jgi:shikimate kinase